MSAVRPDGSSDGAHLRQARKTAEALGMRAVEFSDPDPAYPPPGFAPLWEAFLSLSNARQRGWAPNPVSYSDVEAYARLHGVRFEGWELGVLRELDRLYLEASAEASKREK